MPQDLVLPVPEHLDASYLVPTATVPPDLLDLARRAALDGDAGRAVPWSEIEAFLADPGGAVTVMGVDENSPLPFDMLQAFGATPDDLAAARAATHFVEVLVTAPPSWPPRHDRAARALAALVATQLGAPVLDVTRRRLLSPEAFLDGGDDGRRFADRVLVLMSPDRRGLWVTTTGLRRFGLPELQAKTVPHHLRGVIAPVMTAVAYALVRAWCAQHDRCPTAAFVRLPALLSVTPRDVTEAYDREPRPAGDGDDAITLRLELDPSMIGSDSFLTINPAPDVPKTAKGSAAKRAEAYVRLCERLLGQVLSDPPGSPRPRTPPVRRTAALAVQRLLALRHRFLAGEFSGSIALVVKVRLQAPQEDVWIMVERWRTPDVAWGVPERDGRHHGDVREGQLYEFSPRDVIDWMVVDERGATLEDAWTVPDDEPPQRRGRARS